MNNSEVPTPVNSNEDLNKSADNKRTGVLILLVVVIFAVIIALWAFSSSNTEEAAVAPQIEVEEVSVTKTDTTTLAPQEAELSVEKLPEKPAVEPIPPIATEPVEPPENALPALDDSDGWLQLKLPELTWRTELLKLVIDEDMIRRFVVFTDNFAQGSVAYEHSPFVLPKEKFSVDNTVSIEGERNSEQVWRWNESSSKRFDTYIDLLRSMDSASLVKWYFEVKPLVDEAYEELGYEDDFTITLQEAITRVLDMELPKSSMSLTRPSVMYKYQEETLESLPDSEKLLLRLGKENLLVIKSVLLEINEKLARQSSGS